MGVEDVLIALIATAVYAHMQIYTCVVPLMWWSLGVRQPF